MDTLSGMDAARAHRPAMVQVRYVLRACYSRVHGHPIRAGRGLTLLYQALSRQVVKQPHPLPIPYHRHSPMYSPSHCLRLALFSALYSP
jgi:hypothetical protein